MDVSEADYTHQRLVEAAFSALEMVEIGEDPCIQIAVQGGADGATLVLLTLLVPDQLAKEATEILLSAVEAIEPVFKSMVRVAPTKHDYDA